MIGQHKPKPPRRPIAERDLLRLVDAAIFGDKLAELSEGEIAEARKSQPYLMLQRIGCAMYRSGEAGLRPRPALVLVERSEARAGAAPVDDEQQQPGEA